MSRLHGGVRGWLRRLTSGDGGSFLKRPVAPRPENRPRELDGGRLDCGDSGAGERPEKSAAIGHQRPRMDLVFQVRRGWPERKPRKG
ncbi:hypothetical protein MTO96_006909 [Rhipicephalus appendiculatus]